MLQTEAGSIHPAWHRKDDSRTPRHLRRRVLQRMRPLVAFFGHQLGLDRLPVII